MSCDELQAEVHRLESELAEERSARQDAESVLDDIERLIRYR